jgi:hypothetical protein
MEEVYLKVFVSILMIHAAKPEFVSITDYFLPPWQGPPLFGVT